MKTEELRSLPSEALSTKIDETREELFNLRFQNATGQLENYKRLGLLKRDLARLQTVLKERELGIEVEVQDAPKRRWRKDEDDQPESEGGRRRKKKAGSTDQEDPGTDELVASSDDEEPESVESNEADEDSTSNEGSK